MFRVHCLLHVPFEGLGSMEPCLLDKNHCLTYTRFYENSDLPSIDTFDRLIIMGGPMGVYDESAFPWLPDEKKFIKNAYNAGKPMLGICLGAQLIASALGAPVYRNKYREIGWHVINRSAQVDDTVLADVIPDQAEVFHWHSDTFALPDGARLVARSDACTNQGFVLGNRVVALQFHLETTLASATALIEHCQDELDGSQFVQTKEYMLSDTRKFTRINQAMSSLLETLGY